MEARLQLLACRSAVVTHDLAYGLRALEQRVAQIPGARLKFTGVKRRGLLTDVGSTQLPTEQSLRPAGREAHLRLVVAGRTPGECLSLLWGAAIPMGFTPYDRYPVLGATEGVFHFLGPWQRLYDSLLSEGRGEVAWGSVCAAAQVDVGIWQGERVVERFVQAQLHRLGFPCGSVDGVIGPRVTNAIRALGMTGLSLEELVPALTSRRVPESSSGALREYGYIVAPGTNSVVATGGVAALRTPQGVALTITGPGRVVLDLGGVTS